MSAVAAGREQPSPQGLPELEALTLRQQIRADCVFCGHRLGARARPVGVITGRGYRLPLAACLPRCAFDTQVRTLRRLLDGLRRLP